MPVATPTRFPKRGDLMFDGKGTGIGFLKATRARNAEEAIGVTEGLVTVLRLTQADIKSAENTLTIAKQFFNAHQYAKAVQAAKRAESIAITLDERFGQYQRSWAGLQSRIESMKKLGLNTESLEKVAGSAEEKVLAGISENGALIPNYLEASGLLNRAEQEGRAFQEKAEMASNRIYVAELAIEALANLVGPAEQGESAHADVSSLEQSLQDATKELALSNAVKAADMAKEIESLARSLRSTYADTTKSLDELEVKLADLRSEGALMQSIDAGLKIARDNLGRGSIEAAAAITSKLHSETKSIGDKYRKATTTLGDAELLYSRLQREGFHSYEADAALREARRAIREGSYGRSISHLERALQAFARRTNVRGALAKSLEETRTRVKLLAGRGLSFMPDIQEVLERAEREFKKGNFGGSSEDLRIATVLLDGVTRAPAPKK
jgi:hypothetical protein